MASGRKPVVVRKFSRDWTAGYAGTSLDATDLEILEPSGKVLRIDWEQVKWVCYVRDLPSAAADQPNPERLVRKTFSVRPRTAGVLLHITLSDGDEIEGLAANDVSLVTGPGLMVTPPDTRSNTQRIFIPRQAIHSLEVISLIGIAKKRAAASGPSDQPELFAKDGE